MKTKQISQIVKGEIYKDHRDELDVLIKTPLSKELFEEDEIVLVTVQKITNVKHEDLPENPHDM